MTIYIINAQISLMTLNVDSLIRPQFFIVPKLFHNQAYILIAKEEKQKTIIKEINSAIKKLIDTEKNDKSRL